MVGLKWISLPNLCLNLVLYFKFILTILLLTFQGDKARVIQTLLFVAGINTLLQALFGTRLPAVVGASYAYVIPILYIINDSSLQRIAEPHVVSPFLPFPLKDSVDYLIGEVDLTSKHAGRNGMSPSTCVLNAYNQQSASNIFSCIFLKILSLSQVLVIVAFLCERNLKITIHV